MSKKKLLVGLAVLAAALPLKAFANGPQRQQNGECSQMKIYCECEHDSRYTYLSLKRIDIMTGETKLIRGLYTVDVGGDVTAGARVCQEQMLQQQLCR